MDATTIAQNAVDAAALGSVYALFALGVAVIFGIMGLVNFAHGELIMIGAFSLYFLDDVPVVPRLVLVLALVVLAALLMERVAFRPVRGASPSTLLVTSFAVSYLLTNLATLAFGSVPKSTLVSGWLNETVEVGDVLISRVSIVAVVATVALVVGLGLFLTRTAVGVQMRAAAEDFPMARMLGVRADRVIAVAFAISGLLAGTAAVLLVAQTGTVSTTIGLTPVLFAFIATVLGGLGNLRGAALGGFALGVASVVLQATLPLELRPYRDAFLFGAVFCVMIARPGGLLGSSAGAVRV